MLSVLALKNDKSFSQSSWIWREQQFVDILLSFPFLSFYEKFQALPTQHKLSSRQPKMISNMSLNTTRSKI